MPENIIITLIVLLAYCFFSRHLHI